MSPDHVSEIDAVQNAALGAAVLWKFGLGFQDEAGSRAPSLLLYFVPLAICFHRSTLDQVLSTRKASGLALFAAKVGEDHENLLAIHDRMLAYKTLSLNSVATGMQGQLLSLNYKTAELRSNQHKAPILRERVKPLLAGAERFGEWCGRLPLTQIASTLKLEF